MAQFRSLKNTDKEYSCTSCGGKDVSIVREDPAGLNPRLKCGRCSFLFNGIDSSAMQEAGIQPSSAETLASADEPEVESLYSSERPVIAGTVGPTYSTEKLKHVARPAYVFLSKPRGQLEFCTKRDFKKTAIRWSEKDFDLYELTKITLSVKVDVS